MQEVSLPLLEIQSNVFHYRHINFFRRPEAPEEIIVIEVVQMLDFFDVGFIQLLKQISLDILGCREPVAVTVIQIHGDVDSGDIKRRRSRLKAVIVGLLRIREVGAYTRISLKISLFAVIVIELHLISDHLTKMQDIPGRSPGRIVSQINGNPSLKSRYITIV